MQLWKFLFKDQSSECGYRRTSKNISGFFNNWKSTMGEDSFVNIRRSVAVTCRFLHELLKTFRSLWNVQTYLQRFHGCLRAVENSISISHAWNVNVVNKGSWVVFHLLSGTQRCCDYNRNKHSKSILNILILKSILKHPLQKKHFAAQKQSGSPWLTQISQSVADWPETRTLHGRTNHSPALISYKSSGVNSLRTD